MAEMPEIAWALIRLSGSFLANEIKVGIAFWAAALNLFRKLIAEARIFGEGSSKAAINLEIELGWESIDLGIPYWVYQRQEDREKIIIKQNIIFPFCFEKNIIFPPLS